MRPLLIALIVAAPAHAAHSLPQDPLPTVNCKYVRWQRQVLEAKARNYLFTSERLSPVYLVPRFGDAPAVVNLLHRLGNDTEASTISLALQSFSTLEVSKCTGTFFGRAGPR